MVNAASYSRPWATPQIITPTRAIFRMAAARLMMVLRRCPFSGSANRTTDASNEVRSEEHTSELQSRPHLVCRLLLEKKKQHTQIDELTGVSVGPRPTQLRRTRTLMTEHLPFM